MQINIDGKIVLMDDDDYERFKHLEITILPCRQSFYVYVDNGYARGLLHRRILKLSLHDKKLVDHINRNTLDCRKENLRLVSYSENQRNHNKHNIKNSTALLKSKFKGVCWNKMANKWESKIRHDNKRSCLWYSSNEEECAYAYNLASQLVSPSTPIINEITNLSEDMKQIIEKRINIILGYV